MLSCVTRAFLLLGFEVGVKLETSLFADDLLLENFLIIKGYIGIVLVRFGAIFYMLACSMILPLPLRVALSCL